MMVHRLGFELLRVLGLCTLLVVPCGLRAQDAATEDTEEDEQFLKGSTETIIQTIDGVYLNVHYWLPDKPKNPKETPIVLMLHMRGRSQRDWFPMAKELQEKGFAVCTFDFRGHGQSREVNPEVYQPVEIAMKKAEAQAAAALRERVVPRGSRAVAEAIDARSKKPIQTTDSIDQAEEFRNGRALAYALPIDVQTVKEFLIGKHNEGVINIQRLGIVAAEMGATIALQWMAAQEFKVVRTRGWEQVDGDLVALVLLSPMYTFDAFRAPTSFDPLGEQIPVMIGSANEGKSADEAGKVARKLRVPERKIDDVNSNDEGTERTSKSKSRGNQRPRSGWVMVGSKLIGSDLLRPPVDGLDQLIVRFLEGELTRDKTRNWQKRVVEPDRTGFGSG